MSSGGMWRSLSAAMVVLLMAVPASGEEPDGSVSLGFKFGGVTGDLSGVNHLISLGNEAIGADQVQGKEGLSDVEAGFEFAAELRARINSWLVLGAGGQSWLLARHVGYNYIYEAEVRAIPIEVTAYWYSPWGAKLNENLDFFAGIGYTSLQNVEVTYHSEIDIPEAPEADRTEELVFKGSGGGLHARIGAEYLITPRFTILGELGYRMAKAKGLKAADEPKITDASNDDLDRFTIDFMQPLAGEKEIDADFTGGEVKITFRFYLI